MPSLEAQTQKDIYKADPLTATNHPCPVPLILEGPIPSTPISSMYIIVYVRNLSKIATLHSAPSVLYYYTLFYLDKVV